MSAQASLFEQLRTYPEGLLTDRPESQWCPMDAEMFETWEQMGGVPADLSTVEALVRMSMALWRKHKALTATLEDLWEAS